MNETKADRVRQRLKNEVGGKLKGGYWDLLVDDRYVAEAIEAGAGNTEIDEEGRQALGYLADRYHRLQVANRPDQDDAGPGYLPPSEELDSPRTRSLRRCLVALARGDPAVMRFRQEVLQGGLLDSADQIGAWIEDQEAAGLDGLVERWRAMIKYLVQKYGWNSAFAGSFLLTDEAPLAPPTLSGEAVPHALPALGRIAVVADPLVASETVA